MAAKSILKLPQSGMSLIEVLVTMVVLAFGLLGVAGLLVGGVSNAANSESRSKASQLAADMADRIRANPTVALSATSEYLLNSAASKASSPRLWTEAAPTSPTTIAGNDKLAWMNALTAQLPQGRGRITNSASQAMTGRQVTIQVAWSACLGTLTDAERTDCENNSADAFRFISIELRL
jgi:type IV pilus assembly protein PilV